MGRVEFTAAPYCLDNLCPVCTGPCVEPAHNPHILAAVPREQGTWQEYD